MTAKSLPEAVENIVNRRGWPPATSLTSLIQDWKTTIEIFGDDYDLGYDEFANDVRVRDMIQLLLDEPSVAVFPEIVFWKQELEQLDQQFRALTTRREAPRNGERQQAWWRHAILARAGDEYANDVHSLFGVEIERA